MALCAIGLVPGSVQAEESSVWELKPYRIQVLLVPDWATQWSEHRLDELSEYLMRRAEVEIGQPWRLDVRPAPAAVRRAVLAASSPARLKSVDQLLARYRDCDKVIVMLLKSDSGFRGALAWEFDWASRRWCVGRRFRATNSVGVQEALFASLDLVFSPLGLVKLASGQRVVLRGRAALLNVRNARRKKVKEGSLFEVVRRDGATPVTAAENAILLVVEEIGEQGIRCRIVTRSKNPLEQTAPESWIAVQARVIHTSTEYALTCDQANSVAPLTQCEVWVAQRRSDRGALAGCLDADGKIVLPATGKAAWLNVRVGAVTLRQYCVIAGVHPQQTINTHLTHPHLLHAAALALCRDDVAELVTLHDTYRVRYRHRLDASRDQDAKALLEEMHELLKPRTEQLLETIRQRRNKVIAIDAGEAERFTRQWTELMATLNKLCA